MKLGKDSLSVGCCKLIPNFFIDEPLICNILIHSCVISLVKVMTYKIVSIFSALLVVLSSLSFSIDRHYCENQLKSISLTGEAKSCLQSSKHKHCHSKVHDSTNHKKGCCENHRVTIESEVDQIAVDVQALDDTGLGFYVHAVDLQEYIFNNVPAGHLILSWQYYKPPILSRDIVVLTQSFLC